jgi:DNA-binding CsgD family transcriptional regulator
MASRKDRKPVCSLNRTVEIGLRFCSIPLVEGVISVLKDGHGGAAMFSIEEFSRVVSEIYASSISPQNWVVALADISSMLDATGSAIYIGRGPSRSVMSATVPSEARKSYIEHFYAMDYVLDAVERGPAGLVHGGQKLVALRTRSEFEADFMCPFGMDDGLFMRLTVGATPATVLVAAPKRADPYDTAERVKFMGALIPHFEQALRTQHHLVEVGGYSAGDITCVIDVIRHGIVIVGTSGVVHLNSAAQRILTSGDGFCIRSGSLVATHTSTNTELQGSIAGACTELRNGSRGGVSFACGRPSGKRPYVVHVLPVANAEHPSVARALVMIIDPEQDVEPPKTLMRRLFGLTNAEAEVALRVVRGDGLKPISEDLALSTTTIKTHLHHIFDKTDTHRQAELVRLLLAIVP